MRILTWQEFDAAVGQIATMAQGLPLCGVYGLPRGGLPLAVALSHRLGVPLLQAPAFGCLLVDDVYETGRTLGPCQGLPALTAVWISKAAPTWWKAAEVVSTSEWLVFPWENHATAHIDEETYRASRE